MFVGELELELGVGRLEVVLGILEILNRTHDRPILVFIGVLLPEQLESELLADQEVVYLPERVVARLYLRVVVLALVLLELVAEKAYGRRLSTDPSGSRVPLAEYRRSPL